MFFPEKIISIKEKDRVLEIGPGADPFHRSDVLLELNYESEVERAAQFGHNTTISTNKPIVYYDGGRFPFENNSFDYVICSHVLEHIDDIQEFLSEIFRVSSAGYFEFPLITYEYLYNFDVHKNFLKFNGTNLLFLKKSSSSLNQFKVINYFLTETLSKGYSQLITELPQFFIQGFEWKGNFVAKETNDLVELMPDDYKNGVNLREIKPSIKTTAKLLLNLVKNKLTHKH